jgi:hypothetical protein
MGGTRGEFATYGYLGIYKCVCVCVSAMEVEREGLLRLEYLHWFGTAERATKTVAGRGVSVNGSSPRSRFAVRTASLHAVMQGKGSVAGSCGRRVQRLCPPVKA